MLSAVCAATFGILIALFGGTFRVGLIDTYLLPTIAGVVVGGVAFGGGRGALCAVVAASIAIQIADAMLLAFGLSYEARLIALAGIVLAASARRLAPT